MATSKKTISTEKKVAAPHHYSTILSPVITEKTTAQSEHNQVTFRVPLTANKTEIRNAVESIWGVTVTSVNTIRSWGKTKASRVKGGPRVSYRSDSKKAIVTLAEGQSIDIGTSL